ncbi:MAG: SRPBCC family protein [Pseudomonadota bacterium]
MENEPVHALMHGSFVIERRFQAPPETVFEAWADPEAKAQWFIGPESWKLVERTLDLRSGGEERLEGLFENGTRTVYAARFHEIIVGKRLVYVYDMYINDARLSVSLASVEFGPDDGGTAMTYTEQAVYLDGKDDTESRRHGVGAHFEKLAVALQRNVPT